MAETDFSHILVVDDEPDLAELFRQKFRSRIRKGEIRFEFAENGRLALEILEQYPEIGVVFTDLNMPEMDGMELLRRLRERPDRQFKTVVISAYGEMSNIRQAMNAGAVDFMVKPIDLNDLSLTLDKVVEEWQATLAAMEASRSLDEARHRAAVVEEAKRLQKEFFDNVTHELRTPLTLLLGPLENALDLPDRPAMIPELEMARKHGHSLQQLIDELLEVAKIDAGALELNLVQANFAAFLRDLADSFRPLARTREIELLVKGEEELWLDFDPPKLRRALGNLVSNALKFTPRGGRVELGYAEEGGQLSICVQDNGPGIAPEDLERVFERFYRASHAGQDQVRTSTLFSPGGTGIGLALVRELVQLHGGQIRAVSGGGARFELRLPLRREAVRGDFGTAWVLDGIAERETDADLSAGEGQEDGTARFKLLLVEDNPDMRQLIRRSIGPEYEVREAENGLVGLELAREEVPDLILSDVMMPEMDGEEFCRRIKSDSATSHVPVVLLTAKAQGKLDGLKTGADAWLSKPFRREELAVVMSSLLESRRRLREKLRDDLLLKPSPDKQLSMEEQFLQSLRKVMDAHLADELFSVEDMASELGMSRKTLYRKLSATTGQSPNQFIRRFRLESAMQLLKDKAAPVGEVAFMTGFASHSYFSKCFLEYFQVSPSEVG